MLALCLGGARGVWADLEAAERLIGDRPRLVIACNFAGIHYAGHLDAWVSLHPEMYAAWPAQRAGNADYRTFLYPDPPERWSGSSGLYAAQIALDHLGADKVILCGVPMDADAGHIHWPGDWPWTRYRAGFEAAHPIIGHQVRSMSGWTADTYGRPETDWLG